MYKLIGPEDISPLPLLLALGLGIVVCGVSARAQVNPATAKQAEPTPTPATMTRARLAAPAEKVEPRIVIPDEPQAADKSAIEILRDQINGAESLDERARLQLELADQLVAAEKQNEAIAELHTMTAADRFDPSGLYNIGNRLVRLDDLDGAVAAYRKAIAQRKGNYSRALNNLGVVVLRQGRWDEAQESFLAALRQEQFRYAEASYNLGRLYATRGETDLAVREWKRALMVDPQHAGARRALVDAKPEAGIKIGAMSAGRHAHRR